jgi:cysteinyl-tRNA synthetase
MHNGLVGVAGEKMSKSLGNSLLVDAMVTQVRPVELRYYLGQAHYRSHIEYSPAALDEAVTAYRRIEGFVARAAELSADAQDPAAGGRDAIPPAFAAALDNDLAVPQALAVVHDTIRDGNHALAVGDDLAAWEALYNVRAMLDVLGLDPLADNWATAGADHDLRVVVEALVGVAIDQRQAARERRDFQAADAIRDGLRDAGVLLDDTPDGTRWTIKR